MQNEMKKLTQISALFLSSTFALSAADMHLADPCIFNDGNAYYLVGTQNDGKDRFEIYVSKDLENWTNKDGKGETIFALDPAKSFAGKRFVAPQLFKIDGEYRFGYSAYRLAFAKSASPTGPFVQDNVGEIPADSKQIDPFVFVDDDGKIYVYFSYLKNGPKIYVAESDKNLTKLEKLAECISPSDEWEKKRPGASTAEGPTLVKRGGKYVLFYSANDFRHPQYAVGYAVADSPRGPWKKAANNPLIRNDIVGANGAGHGDVFFDNEGKMWYVFHTHYSDKAVHPRKTAVIRLKETFKNGIPQYEAERDTFRYLKCAEYKNCGQKK